MPLTLEQIEAKVANISNLPTLPGVVKMLTAMVENETISAADIGAFISRDHVLSAKLLRLVNSPLYGFPGRISSVTHALVLLGFNAVKGLVLGTAVFDSLAEQYKGLWEHSLGCAVLSRRIAKELAIRDSEEIMLAGLLHDIGKVILSHILPGEFTESIAMAKEQNIHIAEAERAVIGASHTAVSESISRLWNLPPKLSEALVYHHRPMQANVAKHMAAIVHVSDILARGMSYGYPGDNTMPPLDHEAFQSLGLNFKQIDRILSDAEGEYLAGLSLLSGNGTLI